MILDFLVLINAHKNCF